MCLSVLRLSEAMASRDAVLSQSPEFKEARIHAFENATAIYDLLTIQLVRWGHTELLHEVRHLNLSEQAPRTKQRAIGRWFSANVKMEGLTDDDH